MRAKTKNRILVIMISVIFILGALVSLFYSISHRLDQIECNIGLGNGNPCARAVQAVQSWNWYDEAKRQGWHEECVEHEIIIHDRFLVQLNRTDGVGLQFDYNSNDKQRPEFMGAYKLVESWNETFCTKWILVKEK